MVARAGDRESLVTFPLRPGLGMDTQVLISSTREPQDFFGLPYLQDGLTRYSELAWAVRANQAA